MRPKDCQQAKLLTDELLKFGKKVHQLPGLISPAYVTALVEQMMESIHRVEYAHRLRTIDISESRTDPMTELFDPLKAAVLHFRRRNFDEAFWLVFLSIHCGKHSRQGWKLVREIYGRLEDGESHWTWIRVSESTDEFRNWLNRSGSKFSGKFGNHRKYESLNGQRETGTGAAVESYVKWIAPPRGHLQLFAESLDPNRRFQAAFDSMKKVKRFGRTARFDYLTMLGKLGFVDLEPDSPHLVGATGPLSGARLLLTGNRSGALSVSECERVIIQLGNTLGVGMQVMEDSLCNWQKSPSKFIPFRG